MAALLMLLVLLLLLCISYPLFMSLIWAFHHACGEKTSFLEYMRSI